VRWISPAGACQAQLQDLKTTAGVNKAGDKTGLLINAERISGALIFSLYFFCELAI